jgi:hypothetical protein
MDILEYVFTAGIYYNYEHAVLCVGWLKIITDKKLHFMQNVFFYNNDPIKIAFQKLVLKCIQSSQLDEIVSRINS